MDLRSCMQVGHIQIFQIPTFPMIGRAPQVVSRKGTLQYIIILQVSDREHYRNRSHTQLKANQVTCTTFTKIPMGPRGGPSWVLANGLQVSTKFSGRDISHALANLLKSAHVGHGLDYSTT